MTPTERAFTLALAERIYLAHEVLARLAEKRTRTMSMTTKPLKLTQRKTRTLPDPGFVKAVEDELDRLSDLPKNWDGYGAPILDKQIIDAARQFVGALPENLAYRPRVVPMSPGNLQFEWHHGSKVLELEFETAQTIHFLQWDHVKGIEEEDSFHISDRQRAVDLIQWLMN